MIGQPTAENVIIVPSMLYFPSQPRPKQVMLVPSEHSGRLPGWDKRLWPSTCLEMDWLDQGSRPWNQSCRAVPSKPK